MKIRFGIIIAMLVGSAFCQVVPGSGGVGGTITGQIQTATGGAIKQGTLTFSLSQPSVLSGTASIATQQVACYTSAGGNIVGVPDPAALPLVTANTASGTLPAGTYYVKVYYYNASGNSASSSELQIILSAQGTLNINPPTLQPSSASGFGVAISTTSGAEVIQGTVTGWTQFQQTQPLLAGGAAPTTNTSSCNIYFSDQLIPTGTYYTVNLTNKNGSQIAGFPQSWCTYGGAGGVINVSQGAPTGNCNTNGVFYPTPIMANPAGNATQSISGGLNLGQYPLIAGSVQLTGQSTPSATLSSNNYQSIDTFGDSITQGAGATTYMTPGVKGLPVTWQGDSDYSTATYANGPTAYAYLLNADFGNAGHNYGRGGDLSTDMSWHVAIWAHPTLQGNPARTGMVGTNDNSLCGTNTNCQDTTTKAELFSAAQATIPDSLKTFANSCAQTGSWSAGDIAGSLVTTTNGSSLTCVSTSSTSFTYIAYEKCDNTASGTANVTVNGVAGTIEPSLSFFGFGGSSIYFANQASFASGSGQYSHCSLALARNGGIAGSNTTVITSTNSGRVEVFWVGGPYIAFPVVYAPPLYVIGGVPYENGNAGQPGVGQYNTIAQNVYTTMLADGNNVRFANVQNYMNSSTDFTGGGGNGPSGATWAASWLLPLHPGDSGHYHIYQAFRDQLTPQLNSPQVLNIWGGPSGSISSANSTGGRFGADGGLGGNAAVTVLTLSQTGNEGEAALNFSTPGSHVNTLGQWGTGFSAGLPGVTGLIDSTLNFFTWNTNPNGDFCTQTAVSYGSPNVAACTGATLYAQGGNAGTAERVGIDTQTPGIYNGLVSAGAEAILQIDGFTQAVNAALVLQNNNASANPYIKLINKQNASGQRDWSIVHRTSPAQLALSQCPDSETSCSTPNDVMEVANSTGLISAVKGFQSGGSAANITGTGACASRSGPAGGATVGQITCTGSTGASTLTVTPGTTAPNGWSCWASDVTHTLAGSQSALSATAPTVSFTSVTANDVVTWGCVAY